LDGPDDLDRPGPSIQGDARARARASQGSRARRLERRAKMLAGGFMLPGPGRCIALDLGTRVGVAVYDARRCGLSDCVDVSSLNLTPRDGEGAGMRPLRFERYLVDVLDAGHGPVTWVAYERVHAHVGVQAAHVYGQLMGVLMSQCEKAGVLYRAVPVSMGKLAATGNGGAPKPVVQAHVHGHFRSVSRRVRSNTRISEDESDALGILMAALMDLD
jgi:Holliday junction resolvasome RuvABC endonuclease subunit